MTLNAVVQRHLIHVQGTCNEQQAQTDAAADANREIIRQLKKSPDNTEEVFTAIPSCQLIGSKSARPRK